MGLQRLGHDIATTQQQRVNKSEVVIGYTAQERKAQTKGCGRFQRGQPVLPVQELRPGDRSLGDGACGTPRLWG